MVETKSYERLSTEDQLFVALDSSRMPMTIALLAIFEDSGVGFDEILATVESRLHLVPRLRRRLMEVPFGQGRPVWVDDDSFDLSFHVRHVGLARPGGRRELMEFASRVFSIPLDLRRPLWEMWIVDMAEGRRALLHKSHHCMNDGMSAVDIAAVLFDSSRKRPVRGLVPDWEPQPPPSALTLMRENVVDNVAAPAHLARRFVGAALKPTDALTRGVDRARGVESFLAASLPPKPTTSLDREVRGQHRVLQTVTSSLMDAKALKKKHGATVNDVVLAAVAGGLGHLLRSRGEDTTGLVVRAVLPVSTRAADQHDRLGNMIAAMVAELPVGERDPARRLELVRECTSEAKSTKQAYGVHFVAEVSDIAPTSFVALAGRVATLQPMYSLVVTNVPGPRAAQFFMGGEILEQYFFGPNLIRRTDLAVAAFSYNGQLNFGLTADRETLPDVAVVAEGIQESLREMEED